MVAPAKAAGALLSIGEVAAETGIPQHVLRYWEGRLPQLQPLKRAGGRRFYRPADVALLRDVQRLIDHEGFTLDGAAKLLRRGGTLGSAGTHRLSSQIAPTVSSDLVQRLQALRNQLARALQ